MQFDELLPDGRMAIEVDQWKEYQTLKEWKINLRLNSIIEQPIARIIFEDLLKHQKANGWSIRDSVSFENLIDSLIESYDEQRKLLIVLRQYVDFDFSDGCFEDLHPVLYKTLMRLSKETNSDDTATKERDLHTSGRVDGAENSTEFTSLDWNEKV